MLVHNGGLADLKYAERVPGAVTGVVLDVDGDYLCTATDLLTGFVLGVIFDTWARQPGRPGFIAQLAENLYQLAARHDPDREDAATSQVNAWLARTHWRDTQSVTADASQWLVDELPQRFALARHILLGQSEEALVMLPALLADGEINAENLKTWPLFDPLRELPGFQRLLIGPSQESPAS